MRNISLFRDTAISHSNIDIRIVTKNIAMHRCIVAALKVMIIKVLGVSSLVYSASNINVPKDIVSNVKGRLFRFLWENKRQNRKGRTIPGLRQGWAAHDGYRNSD